MKYDAFISYRRENGFLMAQVILYRLKERGIHCFLDLEEGRSGDFDKNLLRAIDAAPNFILVLPKGALDRCVEPDDWVRQEIVAAVRGGKNIIPVMFDGFDWPQEWPEGIPEELKSIRTRNGVSLSQEYLAAMIDKIVGFLEGVTPGSRDADDLFGEILRNPAEIAGVDLAFHAGAQWRRDDDKMELLQFIGEQGIPLRVLVNSPEALENVVSHMRQPLKTYRTPRQCVEDWMEVQAIFPENVQVRVLDIPLNNRTHILWRRDGSGVVNVKNYNYGRHKVPKSFSFTFLSGETGYEVYTKEFEYLWNLAGK